MADVATDRPQIVTGLEGIPQPGDVIVGKFIVERTLGIGGMGVVVAARHIQLGQSVAIKFLRRAAASSPEAVNRFLREARASVNLQSAHVVRVMDVGTMEDGLPFMVMEYLDGTDLGQSLEARGVIPVEEAVDSLVQAMDAVAEAHSLGIVHRDLKPSNLFLTMRPDGSPLVKVLDFGISKAVDAVGQSVNLTATSMVLGSPLYMSPEQVRSTKNVDTRTDVWALGVILYEFVAGVPPFEAETVTGLCAKIVADPPVPLRSRRPEVAPAFESIVNRCLDKDVTRRFRSVAELASALRPYASVEGKLAIDRIARMSGSRPTLPSLHDTTGSAAKAPSMSGPVDGPLEVSAEYAETVASWQTTGVRRNRRIATGLSVLVAAFLATGAAFVVLKGRSAAHEPAVAADMNMVPLRALSGKESPAAAGPGPEATATPEPAASAVVVAASAGSVAAPVALVPSAPPPSLDVPAAQLAAPANGAAVAPVVPPAGLAAAATVAAAGAKNVRPPAPPSHPVAPRPPGSGPSPKSAPDDLLLDRK